MNHLKLEESAQQLKSGLKTKALYIKHLSMSDWNLIAEICQKTSLNNVADVIRKAIRLLHENT